jgi:nucleoside-diphosphate-sugar epimerase
MSFILAEDLAEVIRRFIEVKLTGAGLPVYHVTDGVPVSLKDIIGTICTAYGWKMPSKSIPYGLLYPPIRFFEKIRGIDPEVSNSPLSSIRLKFAGQTQSFSNEKLMSLFPDLKLTPFLEGFPDLVEYYRQFAE